MKKTVATFLTLAVAGTSFADSEIKKYWDSFYTQIRQCVIDEVKTKQIYEPAIPVRDKSDLVSYFKALDYTGYVVVVDTTSYSSSDICYLKYVSNKLGYKAVYYRPVEKLVIASFDRKTDALILKQKLLQSKIKYVDILEIY